MVQLTKMEKRKKRQSGLTMVETIVACVLLMIVITIFGSLTMFTVSLSFREKEQAQTAILTDTLITRIDETLRFASIVKVEDGKISFTSDTYKPYYIDDANPVGYATLQCNEIGHLVVQYNDKDYELLPEDSYESMQATLRCQKTADESGPDLSYSDGVLKLSLWLSGRKYGTAYHQDFFIRLVNG